MSSELVIAIDGPAGAGKSTVAKILARDLELRYLDTGAMYRALALKALRQGVHEGQRAAGLLEATDISFGEGDPQRVLLDGEDVTAEIRTPEVGEAASSLSTHPLVRAGLVRLQQQMVAQGGVILEGRDATTVIAPNADLKVYMTASLEERAKRRMLEFQTKGLEGAFEEVRGQIENRDHRDITRTESPLRVASDAHVVETATRTVAEVVDIIKILLNNTNAT